jgi:hypothetical protein
MKTKTFFLLCLLLGMASTQLSAQNSMNGTGSQPVKWVWDTYYIDIPINCNEAVVDRLWGSVTVHQIDHYKNGVIIWAKEQFDGEATSQKTGEVFKVKDIFEIDAITWEMEGHCNLIGSYGTHYILSYIYYSLTDTFEFVKATCPGNNK